MAILDALHMKWQIALHKSKFEYYCKYINKEYWKQYMTCVPQAQAHIRTPMPRNARRAITLMRTRSHMLKIEIGGWQQIDAKKRTCNVCDMKRPETEEHVTLECPAYTHIRDGFKPLLQGCTTLEELLTKTRPSPTALGINSQKSKAEILSQKARSIDPTRIIQLAWKPRAFLYKGFLSDKECEHLKKLARDKLEKSLVADNESGKGVVSDIRTSSGMFIDKGHDDVVKRIENRLAMWTFLPEENGEALQVLKYEHGEKYEPHYDFFQDKYNIQQGGHRVATVLMYLSNVTKGGETIFPNAPDHRVKDDTWSDCARRGLSVKPTQGDALLFFSLTTEGKTDTTSLILSLDFNKPCVILLYKVKFNNNFTLMEFF
ncbi:hypothetical protein L7F22_031006 [Adiantum nelumboides]|nr:hypothetical protein [Adiantum nelumboides]